jgi:5-methyltetrahydropteroyltriglutamate--homocysteine methyltransferase
VTDRPLFPAQEIGSLARPAWQLQLQRGEPLGDRAREEFEKWDTLTGFSRDAPDAREALLHRKGPPPDRDQVQDLAALFGLRFLETSGLARVYDGEARRVEMYEYPIRQMGGFRFEGHVRSFDNKYYRKATVVGPVDLTAPYHLEEFDFVKAHAHAEPKLPLTGAYTLANWSYNEYYLGRRAGWKSRSVRHDADREFVTEIARKALRPTIATLIDHGCKVVQIDEPAAGTRPDEVDLVVEGFNAATEGLDAEFTMHICFSDYAKMLPALLEAKRCTQWAWEFANRDTEVRDGYSILKTLRDYGDTREIGLGVVDVHRDEVETPELVRERIVRAAKYVGDPRRIWVNPDCGLRTRALPVAAAKLAAIVDGANHARAEFENPRA